MDVTIKRALISVSDKTNLDQLAICLAQHQIEIISTGGTANYLKSLGYKVIDISEYTGAPEIMDGRVKTLHPKVHGGLLGCLDNPTHLKAMEEQAIPSIDLVVVNLYPFAATVKRNAPFEEIIENIDIGGPSMIRSAAKNYRFTTIVTDCHDYAALIEQINQHHGKTNELFRLNLAIKAFATTATYDTAISQWFYKQDNQLFPPHLQLQGELKQVLRYGENPHQQGAFYATAPIGIAGATQIQGKELSYNNIHDADAALQLVMEFKKPTAAIIKHTNPCGIACADDIEQAYDHALMADPLSAFGGILAFNRPISVALAEKISHLFAEAIIAPSIEEDAKILLSKKKNLRVLLTPMESISSHSMAIKTVLGGFLIQEIDQKIIAPSDLHYVTNTKPSDIQLNDLLFAFNVCKHVKSNAIVVAHNETTLGIGAGQMSRVDSVNIALSKAATSETNKQLVSQAVLASDAFFPFADSVHLAAKAGIKAIIQPGGSVRDKEVIQAANEAGIAMVFTDIRHFRH